MNFIKRATISIKRRPVKTLILLLLIFILGSVIAGAISVTRAIANTDTNLRRGMRPIVTIDLDEAAIMAEYQASGNWNIDLVSLDTIRAIGNLSYVAYFDYSIMAEVNSRLSNWTPDGQSGGMIVTDPDGNELEQLNWFNLQGSSNNEPMIMREGLIELVEGSLFNENHLNQATDIHPAIISSALAEINNLTIGSLFTMEETVRRPSPGGEWDPEFFHSEESIFASAIYEFEVIGMFEPIPLEAATDDWRERERIRDLNNRILTLNHTAEIVQGFTIQTRIDLHEAYGDDWGDLGFDPENWDYIAQTILILHDPLYLEDFRVAAEAMLPNVWMVSDLLNTFSGISSSMETLQGIADWIFIVSVGATLLILSLLITLFLKDRRYEMGIYLALGEKKSKIISQILIETVTTALIGITLAVFMGHFVSSTMSQNMMRNELSQMTHERDMGGMVAIGGWSSLEEMGLARNLTSDEMMDAFDVSLDIQTIGIFYAVGLSAVIVSTIIPVLYIVALKPKKVLI